MLSVTSPPGSEGRRIFHFTFVVVRIIVNFQLSVGKKGGYSLVKSEMDVPIF